MEEKKPTIDSGPVSLTQVKSAPLITEEPEQDGKYPRWEYPERRDPKWGTITKQGLIVGRKPNQRIVPPDEVWKLAEIGCTDREISQWFQISESTLRYNFSEYIEKGRAALKRRLRAMQLQVALQGNPSMLIWLGKNILGQSDQNLTNNLNDPLPWNDDEK